MSVVGIELQQHKEKPRAKRQEQDQVLWPPL